MESQGTGIGRAFAPASFSFLIALALLCLAVFADHAHAATTRTVTSTADDGGAGTLRTFVNASANGDTINFSVTGTITLTNGELGIGRNLTIIGPAGGITVSGNNASRVFNITAGTVNISRLTIINGHVVGTTGAPPNAASGDGQGGGILNQGTLNLDSCALWSNSAAGGDGPDDRSGTSARSADPGWIGGDGRGGAIANQGTLNIANCTFSDNTANGGLGGLSMGLALGGGGNGMGGAIANESALYLVNCTFSQNSAIGGGAVDPYKGGNAQGGGVFDAGSGNYRNVIIANNSLTSGIRGAVLGPDVNGPVSSQGHNFIGNTDGSSGWVGSDLTGTIAAPFDPLLGSLQNNGGPTYTMALLPNSAAIDAGDDAVTNAPYNLLTDQRGYARKFGAHVDIGAYEINPIIVLNTADSGPGSLRQAVLSAAPGNVITFAPGLTGTIILTTGELLLNKDLSIIGPGAAVLAISGNTSSRVFNITNVTVHISGLGIRNGLVSGGSAASGQRGRDNAGAGILNYGVLSLSACEVFNNTVFGGKGGSSAGHGGSGAGGGLANFNTLSLSSCYIHDNSVNGGLGGNGGTGVPGTGGNGLGGGIYNESNMVIIASTISSNTASFGAHGTGTGGEGLTGTGFGGGLASVAGTVSKSVSTLANNTANGYGGGVYYSVAAFDAIGCTISGNTANLDGNGAGGAGGGIYGVASVGTFGDSIVAGNTAGVSPDLGGSFTTHGYNLIGIQDGSSGFANGVNHDQAGIQASPIDPLLAPLADNGGPTPTMSLSANSPAIDKGNRFGLVTDQRGRLRPYDFAGIGNAAGGDGSDIGAFELNLPILNVARSANQVVLSWPVSDTGYTLQFKTNLTPSIAWSNVLGAPILIGSKHFMTNSGASGNKFYRLAK